LRFQQAHSASIGVLPESDSHDAPKRAVELVRAYTHRCAQRRERQAAIALGFRVKVRENPCVDFTADVGNRLDPRIPQPHGTWPAAAALPKTLLLGGCRQRKENHLFATGLA
jgi:hypothetical protein